MNRDAVITHFILHDWEPYFGIEWTVGLRHMHRCEYMTFSNTGVVTTFGEAHGQYPSVSWNDVATQALLAFYFALIGNETLDG
jgi:hypothetical protein